TFSGMELRQSGLQISPNVYWGSRRIKVSQESYPPDRRSAYAYFRGAKRDVFVRADQYVVSKFWFRECNQFQFIVKLRRKILGAVHGNIDRSIKQICFDLLSEHSLATNLGDAHVQYFIAAGFNWHNNGFVSRRLDKTCDMFCLP